jgi:hypothetical protein
LLRLGLANKRGERLTPPCFFAVILLCLTFFTPFLFFFYPLAAHPPFRHPFNPHRTLLNVGLDQNIVGSSDLSLPTHLSLRLGTRCLVSFYSPFHRVHATLVPVSMTDTRTACHIFRDLVHLHRVLTFHFTTKVFVTPNKVYGELCIYTRLWENPSTSEYIRDNN